VKEWLGRRLGHLEAERLKELIRLLEAVRSAPKDEPRSIHEE
jgi:hypothetical protein